MTRVRLFIISVASIIATMAGSMAATSVASSGPASSAPRSSTGTAVDSGLERHHYRLAARVRPLVVFWISRSNVGDAVMTRARGRGEATYSVLIGSDPNRAPFHINRWGYIEEEIRGAEARLFGLMTESNEESIQEAEATVRQHSGAHHSYRVIEGTSDRDQAFSRVTSVAFPQDYTLREMRTVLDLAQRDSSAGKLRSIQLPPGARPGFLAALADSMHTPSDNPITFVYFGQLYELRRTRTAAIPNLQIERQAYGPAVAVDFLITSTFDGEQTKFSMTYGTRDDVAEVPLRVMFQPRWWMQVELTIDDDNDVPSGEPGLGYLAAAQRGEFGPAD